MRDERSPSQVLFGFLPEQTVDVKGGVWKVKEWRYPDVIHSVHAPALREELCRMASPWELNGCDDGFANDMRRGADLQVVKVSRDNGVQLEPFPRQWVCKGCSRVHTSASHTPCPCGHRGSRGQMPFVGYHECGNITEAVIPRCPAHRQVRVYWPGTASARELRFECPVCDTVLQRGLGFKRCGCGIGDDRYLFTVHRAASVYTPRSCVVVNPPSREKMRVLTEAGGPARALRWVVDGMPGKGPTDGLTTREALRRDLRAKGLSEAAIDAMLTAAEKEGTFAEEPVPLDIPPEYLPAAEREAVTVALSVAGARATVEQLLSNAAGNTALVDLYEHGYPAAFREAGLESIELIDKFPVLSCQFGYTRDKLPPGQSTLRTFRDRRGRYTIHGDLGETEALLVRLDPMCVLAWLRRRGYDLAEVHTSTAARVEILRHAVVPDPGISVIGPSIGAEVLTLIHSYAHRFLRETAVFAGIERAALAELLVPRHLAFYIYAAPRGDFVLGGLQALFEGELDKLLNVVVFDEHRCALDPGCSKSGGACPACLHLGEPSCQCFNLYLTRSVLFDEVGYLRPSAV
ncbi:MAG: hypothetical protein JSS43_14720 [Proteobacteria bacterium]|nr:hypothetical protein [Pseudomonadota bacterium]